MPHIFMISPLIESKVPTRQNISYWHRQRNVVGNGLDLFATLEGVRILTSVDFHHQLKTVYIINLFIFHPSRLKRDRLFKLADSFEQTRNLKKRLLSVRLRSKFPSVTRAPGLRQGTHLAIGQLIESDTLAQFVHIVAHRQF